jgi:hypothetical protein
MSQTQAWAEPESTKVQVEERAPTILVLSLNSPLTLYLTIFYVQRIKPTLEDYSSLELRCLLEGSESFYRGAPSTLWAHESMARLHLDPTLQTNYEAWWRLNLKVRGWSPSDERLSGGP